MLLVFTKVLHKHAFSKSWNTSLCHVKHLLPASFLMSRWRNGKNYQQYIIPPVREELEVWWRALIYCRFFITTLPFWTLHRKVKFVNKLAVGLNPRVADRIDRSEGGKRASVIKTKTIRSDAYQVRRTAFHLTEANCLRHPWNVQYKTAGNDWFRTLLWTKSFKGQTWTFKWKGERSRFKYLKYIT
jgi:hypothetical protein